MLQPNYKSRLVAVFAGILLAGIANAADYRIVRSFAIPGAGGWDYLTFDADGGRLFIARSDRVQVVDPVDGRLLGEVPGTAGVHGVALVPHLNKGYSSNGRAGSIGVFDLRTLRPLSSVATPDGKNPDFIVYNAVAKRVVAFNGASANASVVDVSDDRLVGTIALPGKPEAAVFDREGKVYVNIEDRNEIAVVDLAKGAVVGTLALPGCDEPAGLAIDAETRRLFVGCHNSALLVVDVDVNKVLATLPIGKGVDAAAFDPQTRLVFTSQGDGTLTIVKESSPSRFDPVQNLTTVRGARTMALNLQTHEIYVVSAEFDEVPSASGGALATRRVMRPDTFRLTVIAEH